MNCTLGLWGDALKFLFSFKNRHGEHVLMFFGKIIFRGRESGKVTRLPKSFQMQLMWHGESQHMEEWNWVLEELRRWLRWNFRYSWRCERPRRTFVWIVWGFQRFHWKTIEMSYRANSVFPRDMKCIERCMWLATWIECHATQTETRATDVKRRSASRKEWKNENRKHM